jgi:K+-sensing histidine kinase KdpD
MTGILGGLDLLAHDAGHLSASDIQELAKLALDGAYRLHQTVESVLRCSRFRDALSENGGCSLTEIAAWVAQVARSLTLSNVAMALPPALAATQVTLGPQAMELILLELLGNAWKFHPQQTPVVKISAERESERAVRLRVEDDGLHLSPEQLAQAFMPYAQGEKYFTGEVAGLGLGLAQVATLVWSVGGSVRISNRCDAVGVAVELILPLYSP